MSRYGYYQWSPYVPVAERRRTAKRKMNQLRKQGRDIQPVEIEGRTIARSFWGKGWCDHLDSFGDYANRLPRGRTYVRNGSVCHLDIRPGEVEAIVSGSSLYHVNIAIEPLKKTRWKTLKKRCLGKIGSLIELLEGKLSEAVMSAVVDRRHGLFPLPGEIKFTCDCPDWAGMCKHIAAVIYGIGARLDTQPELLFRLRGVDHHELIAADTAAAAIVGRRSQRARRRKLTGAALENVFGVELDDAADAPPPKKPRARRTAKKKAPPKSSAPKAEKRAAAKPPNRQPAPFKPTGRSVTRLRRRLGLNRSEFAREVGVSSATVANWEKTTGAINPHYRGFFGLNRLHDLVGK